MEGAGKRITRPPDRLIDHIFTLDNGTNQTPSTITSVTNPSTMSSNTTDKIIESTNKDAAIMSMLTEILSKANDKAAKDEIFQTKINDHITECVQRWQIVDTRITKLEDDSVHQEARHVQQQTMNKNVSQRVDYLEHEVLAVRTDLSRLAAKYQMPIQTELSNVLPPTSLSSTVVPPNTINQSLPQSFIINESNIEASQSAHPPRVNNTCNQIPINSVDLSRSSFFGSQERLQDAVSEFSGNMRAVHPEKFLAQLGAYFEQIQLTSVQQLICAQRRLSGDALTWYESLVPPPEHYVEFCLFFRQRFWSPATQRKARNEVFRPFSYTRSDGLATHAMKWIASAKYITPPIDQEDLVSVVIQHYPTPLSMALRGRGPRNTNELLAILTEFEEATSFCETRREDNRSRNINSDHPPQNRFTPQTRENNNFRNNNNNTNQRFTRPSNQPLNQPSHPVSQINVSGNAEEPHP